MLIYSKASISELEKSNFEYVMKGEGLNVSFILGVTFYSKHSIFVLVLKLFSTIYTNHKLVLYLQRV